MTTESPQSTTSIKATRREQQILTLIAEGNTSKKIGELLGLSARTIERHRANLLKKFRQKNSVSLVQSALRHGLLSTEEGI
jgi:DNA-binding NarL/FixJ family response regulator